MSNRKCFCTKCGREMAENERFCTACGTKRYEDEKSRTNSDTKTEQSAGLRHIGSLIKASSLKLKNETKCFINEEILKKEKKDISSTDGENNSSDAAQWSSEDKFALLCVFTAVCFVAGAVTFINGKIGAGIIALIQFILLGCSLLAEKNLIPKKDNRLKIAAIITAAALAVPFLVTAFPDDESDHFKWSEIVLSEKLPDLPTNRGSVVSNGEDRLVLEVNGFSHTQYNSYVSRCEKAGYTIDKERQRNSFKAKSDNGFKIELVYFDSTSSMTLRLYREEKTYESEVSVLSEVSDSAPEVKSIAFADTADLVFPFGGEAKNLEFKLEIIGRQNTSEDLIEYVSENTEVAVAEKGNETEPFTCIVRPTGTGETYIYICSKDKKITSERIKVTVEPEKTETAESIGQKSNEYENNTVQSNNEENNYQDQTPEKSGRTVYITPKGKKYHYSEACAGKNAMATTEESAKLTRDPCKKCVG